MTMSAAGGTRSGAYDAVVVGGGHNGLVVAAYLGRAGMRTLLLERRERLGGASASGEIAPGFVAPTLAHTVGRLRPAVVRELGLRRHGLSLVQPDVRVFAPQRDGRAVTIWGDLGRTAGELRAWSAADAEALAGFDARVRSLGRFVAALADTVPPDLESPALEDAFAGLRLARSFRGLGRVDGRTLLRVLPMAVADFVAESFSSDPVRAAFAFPGVRLAAMGPWSAGSAGWLLTQAAGVGGAADEAVFARGGPGAVAAALEGAVRSFGGDIRCAADVVAVRSSGGRVRGVALASGEEIDAAAVIIAGDPKGALLRLVDPIALGPTLRWRASNIRNPGVVAKVNLALARLPEFPAAGGDERRLRGKIVIGGGIDDFERAFDASKYGRVSESPVLEATIPSLVDPSLVAGAPEGGHVMSVVVQYAPYALREGGPAAWDGCREDLADRVVAVLETHAPGIASLVRARQVITPLDLERGYGLTGGHPLHGEPTLDQWFLWRPLLGHAGHRLALDGLYLASAGSHPGGGITGAPGRQAARVVIDDLRIRAKD